MLAADPGRSQLAAATSPPIPGSLTGRRIAGAAQDGDPLALAAIADFARWLGLGLAMVGDIYDPDLVVIAGGVAGSASLFLDDAREHYAARSPVPGIGRSRGSASPNSGDAAGMSAPRPRPRGDRAR